MELTRLQFKSLFPESHIVNLAVTLDVSSNSYSLIVFEVKLKRIHVTK